MVFQLELKHKDPQATQMVGLLYWSKVEELEKADQDSYYLGTILDC